MGDIRLIVGSFTAVLLGAYIGFILTGNLCSSTPSFCTYGWGIYGAYIIGAGIYLKYTLFGN